MSDCFLNFNRHRNFLEVWLLTWSDGYHLSDHMTSSIHLWIGVVTRQQGTFQINASWTSVFEFNQVTRDFFKILVCPEIRTPNLQITSPTCIMSPTRIHCATGAYEIQYVKKPYDSWDGGEALPLYYCNFWIWHFVSSHIHSENPEGTRLIVGSIYDYAIWYISDTARNRPRNLFRPQSAPIPLGHRAIYMELSVLLSCHRHVHCRGLHGDKKPSQFPPRTQCFVPITAATSVILLKLFSLPRLPRFYRGIQC